MKKRILAAGLISAAALVAPAQAEELTVWLGAGDIGVKMMTALGEVYQKTHPDVTLNVVTMPHEQVVPKATAAINTNTAPDLIFIDNPLLIQIEQSTGKLLDMSDVVKGMPEGDRAFLNEGDIASSSYQEKMLMLPVQRVAAGWGVRKSWLEKLGETYPANWDDALRIAARFQNEDPDGNGKADTYGMAFQGGGVGSLVRSGSNLLVFGSGAPHAIIDDNAEVVLDRPEVAEPTIAYLKLYTENKVMAPETLSYTFNDMYQLVEGGRAGMFRAGNWNVTKWDNEAIKGDYVVGPIPAVKGGKSSFVVSSRRSVAIPGNAANLDAAKGFAQFLLSKEAQQISLEVMGGVVRSDLDTSKVTANMKPFLDGSISLVSDDNMTSRFQWFPELEETYYQLLQDAIANPPADWSAWIAETSAKLREKVAGLRS